MEEECEICRYWLETDFFDQGKCRKRSPVMVKIEIEINGWEYSAQFPRVHNDGWCGDWEKKVEEPEDD
jgi:hypothetical protein